MIHQGGSVWGRGKGSTGAGLRHLGAVAAISLLACVLTPCAAMAHPTHRVKEAFDEAAGNVPSFLEPAAVAIAPAGAPDAGDLYVADLGVNEVQSITISGAPTGGSFKLAFEGCETGPLPISGTASPSAEVVEGALRGLTCIGGAGNENVSVDETGALPGIVTYTIRFRVELATTDVAQVGCDGTALSGGSSPGCATATAVAGITSKVKRFKPNGEPDDFTALGGNAIEGLVLDDPIDLQIAIAPPGATGGTEGDIYVPETTNEVAVFAPDGSALGLLDEYLANERQKISFAGLETGDRYNLGDLPASCSAPDTGPIAYSEQTSTFLRDIEDALKERCGANFRVLGAGTPSVVAVEFIGVLAGVGQQQLTCTPETGIGTCSVATVIDGGGFEPVGQLTGVAVDASGAVYVSDLGPLEQTTPGGWVHKYVPTANPPAASDNTWNSTSLGEPSKLAVGTGPSAGRLFVKNSRLSENSFLDEVDVLDATSGALKYPILGNAHGSDTSVAVDPADGHLLVAQANHEVSEYDASGSEAHLLDRFPTPGEVSGMGVDEEHNAYLSLVGDPHLELYDLVHVIDIGEEKVGRVGKTTAKLEAVINTESTGVTECTFEYGVTESYGSSVPCREVDGTAISGPGEIPVDNADHTVSAGIAGLLVNTPYHFRLHVANSVAPTDGKDGTFETLGPPVISASGVSGLTTTRVRVGGQIDPRGEATTYAVEYLSEARYAESGWAAATTIPVPARAVGSGIGKVAVSQEIGSLVPDTVYRARLVAANSTDPPVHGEEVVFATFATESGLADGRAYEMVSPPVKGGEVFPPEGQGELGGTCPSPNQRCFPGGERTKMPMQVAADGSWLLYEGQAFQPSLGSESNEYLARRDPASGWATEGLSEPEYRTNSPFVEHQTGGFLAFSPDASRAVLFQVEPSLSSEAPANYANLYLWEPGGLLRPLVTAAPPHRERRGSEGLVTIFAGANSGEGVATPFSHVAFQANDALTAGAPAVGASEYDLYEWSEGQLRLVNVLPNGNAAPGATIGSGHLLNSFANKEGPVFERALSADGSHVYWTDLSSGFLYVRIDGTETKRIPGSSAAAGFLTANAQGTKVLLSSGRLYDLEGNKTTDLTAGLGGFQGVLGASEALSRIYFVDTAVLSGEVGPDGEHAEAGAENLYFWEEGGPTRFIGRLVASDNAAFGSPEKIGTWKQAAGQRLAQVSPDGRYLAFNSAAELTGYDNAQRGGAGACGNKAGPLCTEVFVYDALGGTLSCASCNPTGEGPLGYSTLSLYETGSATFLPPLRNLTAGGRVFFESQDALSPQDANGRIQDIYEWEPAGIGSCARAGGCVSLISSGRSATDSQFLDATPSGSDAFFITHQRLLPQDKDDYTDVYDARVGGGFAEAGTAPCAGEGCLGPPAAEPAQPSAGTAALAGSGNPKPKKRHHKKHHKKHHSKKKNKHGGRRGKKHTKRRAQGRQGGGR